MSKRLKNYPDPSLMFDKYGADALRYYLVSSPVVHGENLLFSEKGLDEIHKKIILRLENVLSFCEMYSEKSSPMLDMRESENVLDKWLISRLNETGRQITDSLEKYELDKAARPLMDFIDDFSTWYIKGSRDRFKSDDSKEKEEALSTTKRVLFELSKLMAPFTPFFAEHVYKKVTGGSLLESVHLESWPEFKATKKDLLNDMEVVRNIVSSALRERQQHGIPVRQPLHSYTLSTDNLSDELKTIIAEMINVDKVLVGENSVGFDTTITLELKKKGDIREFIRVVQDLRKEKNLTPDQKIILEVETSGEGKAFLQSAQSEISKPTNISEVKFESQKVSKIKVGDFEFGISIIPYS